MRAVTRKQQTLKQRNRFPMESIATLTIIDIISDSKHARTLCNDTLFSIQRYRTLDIPFFKHTFPSFIHRTKLPFDFIEPIIIDGCINLPTPIFQTFFLLSINQTPINNICLFTSLHSLYFYYIYHL